MMETVEVTYKLVDGAHFFVANCAKTTGLCIAHQDMKVAYDAVAPTLSTLFKENYDRNVRFEPLEKFASFKKHLKRTCPLTLHLQVIESKPPQTGQAKRNLHIV